MDIKRLFELALGIAGIGAALWGIWTFLGWVFGLVTSIESDTLKIALPTLATLLVGFAGHLVQKHAEKKKEIELKLREQKVQVYDTLLRVFVDFMKGSKNDKGNDAKWASDLEDRFIEMSRLVIMWGSDDVITKYVHFRAFTSDGPPEGQSQRLIERLGALILAIRRDLGHKNKGISGKDLLGLLINGLDEHLERSKSQK